MKPNFINKIKLPKVATKHPIAFWATVILHILLFWFVFFNSNIGRFELPKNNKSQKTFQTIKAVIVYKSEINAEKKRLNNIKKKRELKLKRDEKRVKELEDERYQKQRKINQLKAKTKKEQQATAFAEKQAEQAKQKKKEAERKEKIAKQKKKEAEREEKIAKQKALTAKKEKEKIQQRRLDETKKFQTEQNKRELTKEIQDEETQERKIAQEDILNKLKTSYVNQIASRVRSEWFYRGAEDDWTCDVYILQDLDGNVQSVNVKDCNISNNSFAKSFKDSIERAVQKASPLPSAPDKEVFENEILFHFKVN